MQPVPGSRLHAIAVSHISDWPSSHAVWLHTHVTQQSYLTGCSNHTISFPYGKTEKLNLIQLSSEQNVTENVPVHVTHAHAHELFCSVPVRGKFSVSGNPPLDYRMIGVEVVIGGGVENFRKINNRELE